MSINQMQQVYGSVCSGIEAASCAWRPLGWRAAWLAEIELFPAAVLAHHFPDVPNLGDMTKLPKLVLTGKAAAPDVLVGGTPCQAFSVAGMREGLNDPRGQLTIKFVELADAIDHVRVARGDDPAVIVWENVPGVLSDKGNAFGCFLGALSGEDCELQPAGGKWSNAGCVFGPKRAVAWRVLDAQYFGVAQRRRRVFVVASARAGFNPAQVLFEFDGLRRDTPPRRGARPVVAALTANGVGTCGADDNQGQAGHLIPTGQQWPAEIASTLNAAFGSKLGLEDQHIRGGAPLFVPDLSPCLETQAGTLRQSCTQAYIVTPPLTASMATPLGNGGKDEFIVFHPTQDPIHSTDGSTHAMGCGSSGGQASVGVAYPLLEVGKRTGASTTDTRAGMGVGSDADPMFTLQAGAQHGVAYGIRTANTSSNGWGIQEEVTHTLDRAMGQAVAVEFAQNTRNEVRLVDGDGSISGALAAQPGMKQTTYVATCVTGDVTNTLKAEGFDGSEDGTGRGQPIVAFQPGNLSRGAGSAPSTEVFPTLKADHGRGASDQDPHVMHEMAVRRLTPRECERLQGFPDNWTLVPVRGKPAADGPRYKALGNSMAVPCMAWIGSRIKMALEWRAAA